MPRRLWPWRWRSIPGRAAPAGASWTLGHAVLGDNRRVVYANGSAVMNGKTDDPNFRRLESGTDSAVESLFFWTAAGKLKAAAINVACPAQAVAGGALNADFWHEVRVQLRRKLNQPELAILGWTGPEGGQALVDESVAAIKALWP